MALILLIYYGQVHCTALCKQSNYKPIAIDRGTILSCLRLKLFGINYASKLVPEGVAFFLVVDIATSFRARDVNGDSGYPVISLTHFVQLHTGEGKFSRSLKFYINMLTAAYPNLLLCGSYPGKYLNPRLHHRGRVALIPPSSCCTLFAKNKLKPWRATF